MRVGVGVGGCGTLTAPCLLRLVAPRCAERLIAYCAATAGGDGARPPTAAALSAVLIASYCVLLRLIATEPDHRFTERCRHHREPRIASYCVLWRLIAPYCALLRLWGGYRHRRVAAGRAGQALRGIKGRAALAGRRGRVRVFRPSQTPRRRRRGLGWTESESGGGRAAFLASRGGRRAAPLFR